jgi:Leucine-rich repeat (LRR) protein
MQTLRLPNACLSRLPELDALPLLELDIHGNRLISLEGLPITLKKLDCSFNCILGDGLTQPLPNLEILILHHNKINFFDNEEFVQFFPRLKILDFSYNCLKHTPFLQYTNIEELYLSENRLHTIVGLPRDLKKLIADTNNISMVQSRLPPLLEIIDLGYNYLHFAGLPMCWPEGLRELHLDRNEIEKFPRNLPDSLEVLTLNENNLTELPSKLPQHLRYLTVNSNRIQYVPMYTQRFTVFLISNNCLTQRSFNIQTQLFTADRNWNEDKHTHSQRIIKQCWKRYCLTLRLRHLLRTNRYKQELFEISMSPERCYQIDSLDPIWFRKGQHHIHTGHH